jgi:hypothetical protein
VTPGGAADWNAEAAAAQAQRDREAAARARRDREAQVITAVPDATAQEPVMSSPVISPEEQQTISRWITLLTIARREPPAGTGQ